MLYESLEPFSIRKEENLVYIKLNKSPAYSFILHLRCYNHLKWTHQGILNYIFFINQRKTGIRKIIICQPCSNQYDLLKFFL